MHLRRFNVEIQYVHDSSPIIIIYFYYIYLVCYKPVLFGAVAIVVLVPFLTCLFNFVVVIVCASALIYF